MRAAWQKVLLDFNGAQIHAVIPGIDEAYLNLYWS